MSERRTKRRSELPAPLQFLGGIAMGIPVVWLMKNLEWLPIVLGGLLLLAGAAWLTLKCLAAIGAILRG